MMAPSHIDAPIRPLLLVCKIYLSHKDTYKPKKHYLFEIQTNIFIDITGFMYRVFFAEIESQP